LKAFLHLVLQLPLGNYKTSHTHDFHPKDMIFDQRKVKLVLSYKPKLYIYYEVFIANSRNFSFSFNTYCIKNYTIYSNKVDLNN